MLYIHVRSGTKTPRLTFLPITDERWGMPERNIDAEEFAEWLHAHTPEGYANKVASTLLVKNGGRSP